MTKLDAGLITSLLASDSGSAVVWGSKRINPRSQSCLCLTWIGYPSNDDKDDTDNIKAYSNSSYIFESDLTDHFQLTVKVYSKFINKCKQKSVGLMYIHTLKNFSEVDFCNDVEDFCGQNNDFTKSMNKKVKMLVQVLKISMDQHMPCVNYLGERQS